jgi:cytochrome c551/c552
MGEQAEQREGSDGELSDDEYAAALERYTGCLAEHGVEVSVVGPEDGGMASGRPDSEDASSNLDTEEAAEVERQCGHLRPDGGQVSQLSPDDLDLQREWVKCLSDAGLEVIDNGDGMPSVGIPEGDEQAAQAMQECDDAVYGVGAAVEGSTP